MNPRFLLRIEGLAVVAATLAAYFHLEGPLWLLVVLALAPDLSMVGYLGGPRFGANVYNAFHTYTVPVSVGAFGFLVGGELTLLVALVWTGHIGADRLLGYGLKHPTGFQDTHLGVFRSPDSGSSDELPDPE